MDQPLTPQAGSARHSSSQLRVLLLVAVAAFLIGAIGVWVLAGTPGLPERFRHPQPARIVAAPPLPVASTPATLPADPVAGVTSPAADVQGGLDQRVSAMEQRLARLDLQSQAASGNAARAEGLLIAFAARRAIERGVALGYLEDQLRLRFGDGRPNAVQAVIDAGKRPVTLDRLLTGLDGLAPRLDKRPANTGALTWISNEFSRLFVVRRANAPSPAIGSRIERARLLVQSGRTDLAAGEIRRLPNGAVAAAWAADADRYAATQRALDLLELTAIQEPRELHDGAGRPVEQLGPAG